MTKIILNSMRGFGLLQYITNTLQPSGTMCNWDRFSYQKDLGIEGNIPFVFLDILTVLFLSKIKLQSYRIETPINIESFYFFKTLFKLGVIGSITIRGVARYPAKFKSGERFMGHCDYLFVLPLIFSMITNCEIMAYRFFSLQDF